MCGIAGWIDWNEDVTRQRPVLQAMANAQYWRGPDAEGLWVSRCAGLAHRRLSIIDPEGGAQPMVRRRGDRTWVIVYNGELYNMLDVRRELEALGHRFATRCDTEVVLAAYTEWGPACVERFNGIYALGIWDEGERRLFLARDRLGVKPLFYAPRGEALVFASELKGLLAHPLVQPELDEEGLAEIFALGPARTPGCGVFRDVYEVKPGWWLLFDRRGIRHHRYWTLESRPHEDDLTTTAEVVRELLGDAVERQLMSDVPVCTLLSGGLDSSTITAFAARALRRAGSGPLRTFSIDYTDNHVYFRPNAFQPDADAPWVKRVSEYLDTDHRVVTLDPAAVSGALAEAVRARDLPGMTDIDSSLYLFCKEIKKEATVALSGECADEVFGGYPWFHRKDALEADVFPWSLKMRERLSVLHPDLAAQIRPEEYVRRRYREALEAVPRLPGESPSEARIREMFYLNLFHWMPTLLDRKDRMSMAVGLEVRVPFCDHRLVEYLWNVPWSMKTAGGREKGLLRLAARGLLPEDVLERKKSPFPKTHHPEFVRACQAALYEILSDPTSPLLPLIDRESVQKRLEAAEELDIPWFGQLMRLPQLFAYLVQVDRWLREYRVHIR
ncbi:MAG: asparagine synthase (glutamine-hydrolyzing) [Alicyclobacillaceae bacterium]|nr:asparagine synthase (glutamine-hydrolyzing) [Alicyclobacillaceae bacterium]